MNRYSKILHHIGSSNKSKTPKSSPSTKKRTFEEYEAEQNKTETDRLKEEVVDLKKDIQFLENHIVQQHETLFELKEDLKNKPKEKVNLQEGLLNEPANVKNSDPLTPFDQKFVTFSQLSDHYRLFTNRILEQMATIGGGGETKLKYLDDIVGIATDPSSYDGKFLKYNHTDKNFVFEDAVTGSQDLDYTLSLGNTSALGMSVGVLTATNGVFTANASPYNPAVQITGIVTDAPSNHGLFEVGELGFEDTNIIASFSDDVNSYTQIIVQNKNSGDTASTDIILNNDRPNGLQNYLDLGINSSDYIANNAFGTPNGGYLYSTGGPLIVGTLGNYNLEFATNNIVSIRLDHDTAVPYFGFVNSTISLLNPLAVFTYDSPQYSQLQIQNISSGSQASIDFIASTDTATDVDEYIDMGINCSGVSTVGLLGPKDGYLYVQGPASGPGGNLIVGTVNGGDVIFHTVDHSVENERMRITDNGVGIGTNISTAELDVLGDVNISGISSSTDTRINSVSEKSTLVAGSVVNIVYNEGGGNIAICTNPTGPITLNVTGIPTDSSFDNRTLTFTLVAIQTSVGYACTAVSLNGVSQTIKYPGGVVSVGSTDSYDIFNFTCMNIVGSASTTDNYAVLGMVNGNFK